MKILYSPKLLYFLAFSVVAYAGDSSSVTGKISLVSSWNVPISASTTTARSLLCLFCLLFVHFSFVSDVVLSINVFFLFILSTCLIYDRTIKGIYAVVIQKKRTLHVLSLRSITCQ